MADGAACTATDRTLVEVLVELIDRHPTNPRDLPREDEAALRVACADIIGTIEVEAGAPVNGRGIKDAIKVRRKGERFELVDGERRWHSARLTGLRRVLAEIVVMSDAEVLEEQLRQHGRELTPLEEAGALARLRDEHKLDVDAIAASTGRTVRTVRKRLALLTLIDPARAALAAGKIALGLAEELATLVDPDAQAAALESLLQRWREGDEPLRRGDGAFEIQRRRRTLKTACFDIADKTLPGGSCLVCPKRSGAQAELFADGVQDKDLCGDAKCFKERTAAAVERLKEKAKADGIAFISAPAEVKKFYPHGGDWLAHDAPVVDLDTRCDIARPSGPAPKNEGRKGEIPKTCPESGDEHEWEIYEREEINDVEDLEDAARPGFEAGCAAWEVCGCGAWRETEPRKGAPPVGWKAPTWREYVGTALAKSAPAAPAPELKPTMYVKREDGSVASLFDKRTAVKALEAAGFLDRTEAKAEIRDVKKPGELTKYEIENKAQGIAHDEARALLATKAAKKAADPKFWRLLAGLILRRAHETVDEASRRRRTSTDDKKASPDDHLRGWIAAEKDEGALRGLVVELLATSAYDDDSPLPVACRFYGIDLEALMKDATARVKAEVKEKVKKAEEKLKKKAAKASAAPAPPAKKASKKPGPKASATPAEGNACGVCGCTEAFACSGGCAWADLEQTLCTCCAQVLDAIVSQLEEHGDTKGDDMLDALGEQFGEEPWWKQSTAERAIAHLIAKGTVREAAGALLLVDVSAGDIPAGPAAARREAAEEAPADGAAATIPATSEPAQVAPDDDTINGRPDGINSWHPPAPAEDDGEACPIDEAAVRRLAKLAGVSCPKEIPPWIEPRAVWSCSRKIFAHVEKAHPAEVLRTELVEYFHTAGSDCVDVALALLVGEKKLHRAGSGKGWRFSLKQPPLPGQAGQGPAAQELVHDGVGERVRLVDFLVERAKAQPGTKVGRENAKALMDASFKVGKLDVAGVTAAALVLLAGFAKGPITHMASLAVLDARAAIGRGEHRAEADPAADEHLLRAVLHAVGDRGRKRAQVPLACKGHKAADVEAAIEQLLGSGKLAEVEGKLRKRGDL